MTESNRQSRRLQLSGGSTFVVSLPKPWIEYLQLKVGDNIMMTKNPNRSITLTPDRNTPKKASHAKAKIGPKDSDESIRRKIIAMYLAGYKSIKISAGMRMRPGQTSMIRSLVRSTMIGTEIVESDVNSLVIQILTILPELSFDVALERMHLMAANMHKEAVESLAAADLAHAEEVVKADNEVDRFSLYMLRNLTMAVQNADMLHEMGLEKPSDCLGYRTAVSRIERIADHAALIAKRTKYLDGPIDAKAVKRITLLSSEAVEVFGRSVQALTKSDYNMAEAVADAIPHIVKRQEDAMLMTIDSAKNASVVKFVLDDIRRTAEYSSDIAEVVMDGNIQSIITD